MCNIAGYVGTKQAAPIIIEMLRKQEPWDAGFYTGIATLHDGTYSMHKVVGSTKELTEQTPAMELPGTVGIIHGRSKGNQDARWAHPFLGTDEKLIYAANGWGGNFKTVCGDVERKAIYEELTGLGYYYTSDLYNDPDPEKAFKRVHGSDQTCQSMVRYMDQGESVPSAMEHAYCDFPREVVGLALAPGEQDRIYWARMNYPMFVAKADHGMYMATTPEVFPEDARDVQLLSPMASGWVEADRYVQIPFTNPPGTVAPITPRVAKEAYELIIKTLSEKELDHDQIDRLIRPLFDEATCPPESALDYMIVNELLKQGKLQRRIVWEPGAQPGVMRPKYLASIKK